MPPQTDVVGARPAGYLSRGIGVCSSCASVSQSPATSGSSITNNNGLAGWRCLQDKGSRMQARSRHHGLPRSAGGRIQLQRSSCELLQPAARDWHAAVFSLSSCLPMQGDGAILVGGLGWFNLVCRRQAPEAASTAALPRDGRDGETASGGPRAASRAPPFPEPWPAGERITRGPRFQAQRRTAWRQHFTQHAVQGGPGALFTGTCQIQT